MNTVLSYSSRICVILLLIGGIIVTFVQVFGIIVGNGGIVAAFGTTGVDVICVIAGIAGIFAFLSLYTKAGKAEASDAKLDTDEAGA